jgi:VIT1/CCC1 family predicted Fe2+/Mn2+ transporter
MTMPTPDPRKNWLSECQAIHLYETLAAVETEPERQRLFAGMARAAAGQADIWAAEMHPRPAALAAPTLLTRVLITLLRWFGPRPLLPALAAAKVRGISVYSAAAPGHPMPTAVGPEASRHRGVGHGGSLRAAVFGVNDGLVSSSSLVLGMAGATSDPKVVLLAGMAGMLAGAFSMAAGEYVSVASQRELFENQIALEREELRLYPAEEAEELALIYAARGLDPAEARLLANRLVANPEHALDTLAREELGLNPDELGSPVGAAVSSFGSFAVGAVLPLLPYLLGAAQAMLWTLGLSLAGLFTVGASLSLFTGRPLLWSGVRMMLIGGAAGGVTFLVGSWFGVSLG